METGAVLDQVYLAHHPHYGVLDMDMGELVICPVLRTANRAWATSAGTLLSCVFLAKQIISNCDDASVFSPPSKKRAEHLELSKYRYVPKTCIFTAARSCFSCSPF